ncbi:DUF1254 domain-containing protein [Pseudomonas kielensis]|jgi:hypothetical protein|uniref:DUF1254 domain-containing protein n=1 Tax=Pseudomonas kielensis TaxID=2762577 RepID=A0A7X1GBX1_9PSED|nr:DUF1254 domain-containing protein [Pseudomonas kielensis]MBC2688743.1 DUF1254 domain-containing protein [Pseudomonas kielensis]
MPKNTLSQCCAIATLLLGSGLLSTTGFAQGQPDALLSMPTSQENIVAGLEADAYANGINAYVWGYPLVRMERVMRDYTKVPSPRPPTSYRAPLNQLGWAESLATPSAKDMPTANNDTLYLSAVVQLDEPYVLHVPDTADRYYVINVFNLWQELEHYVGRRTTGTAAGDYVLVPPGWQGTLPAGLKRLDVSTRKAWLWGRLHVKDGEDLAPLHSLQKQFTLRPLSQRNNPDYQPKSESLSALPAASNDGLDFFRELAAALKDNPVPPRDEALFAQFARFGLTARGFDPSRLTPAQKAGLLRALADGPKVAVSAMATAGTQRNGWTWATGLDSFGSNYPLRALVSGPYLGGQGEKEAMYPLRSTDAKGEQLTGAKRYVLHFKSTPPVDAFWSLTVYNAVDKMLVDNPIARYKLGSDTPGLKVRADGSFDVPLQAEQPNGEFAANWLPAPKGPFYMILRLYQPKDEVLKSQYELPQVQIHE